jgi:3-methyladenine DNA glycosylase AlkC
MPEPFKSFFDRRLIEAMGDRLAACGPFDRDGFVAAAAAGLEALELKARSAQIARALDARLPPDFAAACELMIAALHPEAEAELDALAASDAAGLRGWAIMPMADVVAARGRDDLDRAMATLAEMTKRFSAEFAVRPLIAAEPDRALAWMRRFAEDANPHVRRLASEGSRPRLPWGMRLRAVVADPAPILPILKRLRDDPSDYVRRSVANSLNDVAKDHPDRVAALAADWLADAPEPRRRMLRHALRGLVKAGHPGALAALGHGPAALRLAALRLVSTEVRFGDALGFEATLVHEGAAPAEVALDYVVHHRKANGALSPKVFKWRVLSLAPGQSVALARRHPMRPITTRVYHDGPHRLEIVANGASLGAADFTLTGVRPARAAAG